MQFKSKFVKPAFRWTSLTALNVQQLKISTTGYKYGSLILSAQQVEGQNGTEFQVQYFGKKSLTAEFAKACFVNVSNAL